MSELKKEIGFNDRAVGVLVGLACGDALGAAYEFGPPIDHATSIGMVGGGPFNWEPGEWTDDTAMAMPIAIEISEGNDLLDPVTLGNIVSAWKTWAATSKDVGAQTSSVLRSLVECTETAARAASKAHHERTMRSGGNGSLMRTAPVALAYLHDTTGLTEAATRIAQLTHWEDDAAEACVLWCHAIRHAVVTGVLDIRVGFDELSEESQERWAKRIAEAELGKPEDFYQSNGWVVSAFQGAWSAISTGVRSGESPEEILERAVRGGGDTDTVASIAGGLVGAYSGVSSFPAKWRRVIHGYPDFRYRDLLNLAISAVDRRRLDSYTGWPVVEHFPGTVEDVLVQHPHDEGVWMASITGLERLSHDVGAVVSMCRVGTKQVPGAEVIEFWLIDEAGHNLNAEFVLTDAANTIAQLRSDGKKVVVHCVAAHNRTPAAAIAYSILHKQVPFETAWTEVRSVLPNPHRNEEFVEILEKISKNQNQELGA